MESIELVIKIPKKWLNDMKREEFIHVDELCEVILHGTKIPENPTNGDIIKAMFPQTKWWVNEDNEVFTDSPWKPERVVSFDLDWWNAPYKAEGGDK